MDGHQIIKPGRRFGTSLLKTSQHEHADEMECDDEGVENVLMSEMKHDEECRIKKRKMEIRAMKRQTAWAAISDQSLFKICLFVYQSIFIFISNPIDLACANLSLFDFSFSIDP